MARNGNLHSPATTSTEVSERRLLVGFVALRLQRSGLLW